MKTNYFRAILSLLAIVIISIGFVGCSSDDDGPGYTVNKLALVDPNQAALHFTDVKSATPVVVKIDTDAPVEAISVTQKEGEAKATWCIVKVKSQTEITVEVAANSSTTTVRNATFYIKAGKFAPVEFTVAQDFKEPADTEMSIDMKAGDYGKYTYIAEGTSPKDMAIAVTTTSNTWTAEYTFYGEDEDAYCDLITTTGRSGDKVIVRFKGNNTTGMMKSGAQITISSGNADPITVYVSQDMPAATSIKVYDIDDWEYTTPLATNYVVQFKADESTAKAKQEFGLQANGAVTVKICTPGTSTEATEPWLSAAQTYGALVIYPFSKNTTATARSYDVVLVGGTTEMFRFKITQAGI